MASETKVCHALGGNLGEPNNPQLILTVVACAVADGGAYLLSGAACPVPYAARDTTRVH